MPQQPPNVRKVKTVQTLPDGSQIVVYSNFSSLPMLKVNIDSTGANMWGTFYRYTADGQGMWEAQPSAVALPASLSTLEAHNDLLNYTSGTGLYQYLHNNAGLINVTTHDSSGNILSQSVQQGQSGSAVLVASYTYTSNTDSSGNTVMPVATSVAYPNASNPAITITTRYGYTWYYGTNLMSQKTTTLPVIAAGTPPAVPAGQNGSGATYTIIEAYDTFGNLTQSTDERSIINAYTYDAIMSRVVQQVLNVVSGVTQPGVNLTSNFSYDSQGRLTQTVGPSHTVVLSGTATAVQPVTWNIYNPSAQPGSAPWGVDSTWTGTGYYDGTNYTLINPVAINNTDKDGRSTDQITSVRSSGSGALSPTDTFNQTDWQSWSSTQYSATTSGSSTAHQMISSRAYFLIPTSGTGTVGVNYGETDYGYDVLERRNRVVSPGGTITRTVWTCPQRVDSVWVGTNDAPVNAIAFVQAVSNSSSAAYVTATLPSNVTAGNTLVAYGCVYNATPGSNIISDTQGNTWTLVAIKSGASGAAGGAGMWIASNVRAGSTTVSILTGASRCALAVAEYSGVLTASPIDVSASASSSASTTTPASGSLTTTNANDVIFAGACQGNSSVTWSAGSGYTLRTSQGSATNIALAIEDQIVTSTGGYSGSFSLSTATPWTVIAVALKSATLLGNMVKVSANVYDGGSAGGDGNLTQQTQYASATDTRVTSFGYDFRDRQTSMTDATSRYTAYTLDNLNRQTQSQLYATSGGTLLAQSGANYDDRNRAFQQITYAVDPATGTVGNALTGNTWYDPSGNVLQQIQPGAGMVFSKSSYNGVNWVTASYRGYTTSGTSYSQATTVANDIIVSQTQNTFDEVGNVVSQAGFQRLNDAPSTGTGSTGALSYGTQPEARVSYAASWFDGIDRTIASANYGAIASFSRPSTPPSSSGTVLVSSVTYDNAGRVYQTTDPKGIIAQRGYDAAGRKTQTIEDQGGLNRTTNFTYTVDNLIATMTAVNATTGNQTTTYTYGIVSTPTYVARNDLLASMTYPDSVSGSDVVSYAYNRLGQTLTTTDQRGTVRTFYYDKLGRITHDCVTTNGTGTDVTVKQIARAYEIRGMVNLISSTTSATPGSGTILNQVAMSYNAFGQLTQEQQDHGGAVSGSSPSVQYGYDSGASSSNEIRFSTLTYPNGRILTYSYGTTGGMNDVLNRVDTIQDTTSGTTNLASYTYLGASLVIQINYPEPSVWLDLWGGTSGTFTGFDLFGRITNQAWQNYNTSTMLDQYQYGYDQNSNRLYKANVVGTPVVTGGLDEYYTYDNLNRLTEMQRGTLNGTQTGITGTPTIEQNWTLDPTGNWNQFTESAVGSVNLTQTRSSSTVNEITAIGSVPPPSTPPTPWVTPVYDPAGNMTTMPQVVDPTQSFTAVYDAWNRMVSIGSSGSTVAQYQYDGRNFRIVKQTYTGGTLSETRHFYFTSTWQDIEQRIGKATTMDQQHVWGLRYIDELVCRDDATPQRLYATQDANFNVTAIMATTGTVQERFVYEPYGNDTVLNGGWTTTTDAFDWENRFTGRQYDAETGVYSVRNRYLNPQAGCWAGRDRSAYIDGSNLYEFVTSNPIGLLDPSGLETAVGVIVCCRQTNYIGIVPISCTSLCLETEGGSFRTGPGGVPLITTAQAEAALVAAGATCCNAGLFAMTPNLAVKTYQVCVKTVAQAAMRVFDPIAIAVVIS